MESGIVDNSLGYRGNDSKETEKREVSTTKKLQRTRTDLQNGKKDCKEYNNPHEIATPKPPAMLFEFCMGGPVTANSVMVCFQFDLFLAL
jgi:hypothetical protein